MINKEMPVFVKIDEYKEVLDVLELMKNKVEQAKELLNKINTLKNEEDSEIEAWKTNIEDIEKKIDNVDGSLLEPENV
jgi:uncharacterized protein Yka (UPF0111/DUF47 family)